MRRLRVTISFLVILFSSLGEAFPAAAEQEDKLAPLMIFDAALKQFEDSRTALRKWQYHQTLITHQMDGAGKVVAKGTWHSIVRPGDPRPLEYTGESMEGKLSFFKAGAEEPAPAKTSEAPQPKTKVEQEKNQAESAVEAVRKYTISAIGISGSVCRTRTPRAKALTSSPLSRSQSKTPNPARKDFSACSRASSGSAGAISPCSKRRPRSSLPASCFGSSRA